MGQYHNREWVRQKKKINKKNIRNKNWYYRQNQNMCFKLKIKPCALIRSGNLLKTSTVWSICSTLSSAPASTCLNLPVATFFFVFWCQALSKTPSPPPPPHLWQHYRPIIKLIQTIRANFYAGSIKVQLQKKGHTTFVLVNTETFILLEACKF